MLLMVLAVGLLLWEAAADKPKPRRRAAKEQAAPRTRPAPRGRIQTREKPRRMIVATPELRHTEVPPAAPAHPAEMRLTEIFVDPADPTGSFAIIDGAAVRVGEEIRGHRVAEVRADRVLLGKAGEFELVPNTEER
jgi:hypothetical protein